MMSYEEQNVQEFLGFIRFTLIRDHEKLLYLHNMYETQSSNNNKEENKG